MRPLKPLAYLTLALPLALPLALAACGDGTDPATTGAVDADPPVVVEPADPALDPALDPTLDPVVPPPAGDTTIQ